jgi:hypothetical protein
MLEGFASHIKYAVLQVYELLLETEEKLMQFCEVQCLPAGCADTSALKSCRFAEPEEAQISCGGFAQIAARVFANRSLSHF